MCWFSILDSLLELITKKIIEILWLFQWIRYGLQFLADKQLNYNNMLKSVYLWIIFLWIKYGHQADPDAS